MKIYVFNRGGHPWADFRLPEGVQVIRTLDVPTRSAADKHLKRETGRIAALLERAKSELPVEVKPTLLGRLTSLFKRVSRG